MIRLVGVRKSYAGTLVVDDVSLTVEPKKSLALMGTSGCGKSTLLRIVLGLVAPDAGTVEVAGQVMSDASARALRRRVGYVVQDGGLFPHLTAEANVALMARHIGWDEARIRARIEALAKLARLDASLLVRYPSQLSGGQRQRVGLMRALMLEPEVLLLDEPLGALDPIVRAQLQDDLRALFTTLTTTVLLVTHDLAEAAFLADEMALMHRGRILQRGSAKELELAPAEPFVREFVAAQRRPGVFRR